MREASSGVGPARRPEMRTMTMTAPPMSRCDEVSLVNGKLEICFWVLDLLDIYIYIEKD